MFRLGVCRQDQFSKTPGLVAALLHGKRVSYRLLRTSTPPTPQEIEIFDHITFYMRLPSGAYRTTAPGRFRDFDAFVTRVLAREFPREKTLLVEDWATSSALTSAEWLPALRAAFPDARLIASDLTRYLVEATVPDGDVYILDPAGNPVQYVKPPFVVRFPEARLLVVNRLLAARARRKLAWLARSAGVDLASLRFGDTDEEIRRAPFVFRPLSLVHPKARALSHAEPGFQTVQHSVFEASVRRPHVVRTMNVLNRALFPEDRLVDAAKAVWRSLEAGGVWIVGRTVKESPVVHHASILRKTAGSFELLGRHVEPSEVEDLALSLRVEDGVHTLT
jgi:hypothetical protein